MFHIVLALDGVALAFRLVCFEQFDGIRSFESWPLNTSCKRSKLKAKE